MSPLQSIKQFCVECMGGQTKLVKGCTSPNCLLYNYRLGKTAHKREMTEEQRQAAAERLKKAREAKKST